MAQRIHPEAQSGPETEPKMRPYTTSGLMLYSPSGRGDDDGQPRRAWKPVPKGYHFSARQPVYLRVTSLADELSGLLQENILPTLPGTALTALEMDFAIGQVFTTPAEHEWAGQASYPELVRQAQGREGNLVELEFASPTTFRSSGDDIPIPLPEHILRSWWLHWNSFAPPEFRIDTDWPKFAADCVRVYSLKNVSTTHLLFANGKRGGATGFHGRVGLVLRMPRADSPWLEHALGAEQVLRALGAFSLYSGTGRQTTMGMGQTCLLKP